MVMRNRHDGANAPQWWDDLPPEVKKRCANSPHLRNRDSSNGTGETEEDWLTPPQVKVSGDFSRLSLIFLAIVFANLVLLLIAVSFLHGRGLFGR